VGKKGCKKKMDKGEFFEFGRGNILKGQITSLNTLRNNKGRGGVPGHLHMRKRKRGSHLKANKD